MAYSDCRWLLQFERSHKPIKVLGESVLLGRWTEKERRELYVDWMTRNGLSVDTKEHLELINMRIVHCFLFASENQRLLPITANDDLTLVNRSIEMGDNERIGVVLTAISDWLKEIADQKKASQPNADSPIDSVSNSVTEPPKVSGTL